MAINNYGMRTLDDSDVFDLLNQQLATNIINESKLSTSEIYATLNAHGGVDQKAKVIDLIKNSIHLSPGDIELAYVQLKSMQDTLTVAGLRAFDLGKVVLLYNDMAEKSITQAIPFMTFQTKSGYVTYVFMDKHVTKNRDNQYVLQAGTLRDLLQSANIANTLKSKYDDLAGNTFIQKSLMSIYTAITMRVLNREYSIGAERSVVEMMEYYINRFFLSSILVARDTPENIHTLSHKHMKTIDDVQLSDMKMMYESINPQTINDLIELLKQASSRTATLDLGRFASRWIDMYYIPSMLAIDNIEYLIFMIICMLSGNNVISRAASEIVKNDKNIKGLREELVKFC